MYKLTNLTLIVLMMLLLTACGNDSEMPLNEGLEDTWTLLSLQIDITSTTEAVGLPIVKDTDITVSNIDYNLTLDAGQWATEGSYDVSVSSAINSVPVSGFAESYDSIVGAGTYTNDANTITSDGLFFEFEYDGGGSSSLVINEQIADYTIDSNDQLFISQNQTTTYNNGETTMTIVATSMWERE